MAILEMPEEEVSMMLGCDLNMTTLTVSARLGWTELSIIPSVHC